MRHIAVIPARSGSKGLKDKNIKDLCGKPLLAYTIEAALASKIFDTVHVSTDSEEYADIARRYGADVPFLRSAETASDTAGSWDVVKEVLDKYSAAGKSFDIVTLLQPTSPLRTAGDIIAAYELYRHKKAKAVVSVCETEHSPLWSNTLPPDQSMSGFSRKEWSMPRQQLPAYYRINGAIYMVDRSFLYDNTNIYRDGSYAYIMKGENSVDIDSELDFLFAQALLRIRSEKQ